MRILSRLSGEHSADGHSASQAIKPSGDDAADQLTRTIPLYKRALLSLGFCLLFLLLEMVSKTAQGWPGAPAFYLPLGLVVALLLWGGLRYWPLVFVTAVIGAFINYHRPIASWCGAPGIIAVYGFYAVAVVVVRKWLRVDPMFTTVRDVGYFALTFLVCAVPTAVLGVLTLLADGLITRADAVKTAVNWWESDVISIISFTPLLLLYASPRLTSWMNGRATVGVSPPDQPLGIMKTLGRVSQAGSVVLALWLVFFCAPVIPYQPLYVLFVPVIWIAVRHGLRGGTLAAFIINVGAMFAADATFLASTGLPRIQLAMLSLALTGLCVGAVVTERKRVEQALAQSESNLNRAQSVANIGSWHVNLPASELVWSYETYRLFNIPVGTPVSVNLVEEHIHPDDRAIFHAKCSAALTTGTYELEHRIRVDGMTKWVSARAEVEYGKSGQPLSVIGTIQDITERRRAEEALRDAEEKYRALFEDAVVGMYQSTREGRLMTVNRALAQMFGYDSPQKMLAAVPEMPRQADGLNSPDKFMRLLETHGMVRDLEYAVRRPDGSELWILENARKIPGPAGETLFIEGAVHDISQRKLLEAQLRQAQKMEAIGRLAGGVAHDFNNALAVMMGYTELAQLKLRPDDPLHKSLAEILKAGHRASSLTRQLLAFSRKQSIQPVVLDLNSIVSDTDKMLRRLIGENIDLAIVRDPNLKLVKADKGQIEQILMNLVVNARDAMPRGGNIVIETANIVFREPDLRRHPFLKPGNHVMLSVTDNGCGMSSEVQAHIFEPFFTTKDPEKGTGLGLSTVYGIVKQSSGFLLVESEVGKGTSLKAYLPQVDAPCDSENLPVATKVAPGGKETVLLVEDEESLRRLARGCLETCGYTVLEACDGRDALNLADRHRGPIHLLLTDVIMPGISGRELADRLKHSRLDVKVLYMSGYTHDLVTQQGILETGCELLHKPFAINSLLAKVRDILDGKVLNVAAAAH